MTLVSRTNHMPRQWQNVSQCPKYVKLSRSGHRIGCVWIRVAYGRSASYYEYARMGSHSELSIRLRLIAIRAMATHLWYHVNLTLTNPYHCITLSNYCCAPNNNCILNDNLIWALQCRVQLAVCILHCSQKNTHSRFFYISMENV